MSRYPSHHPLNIQLSENKKAYFASDFHLGAPDRTTSRLREQKIIRWLNEIQQDAEVLFLLGDIFDFWFEYKHTIPKGFLRLQAKLAEFCDRDIPVIIFTGNHDMWMYDYIPEEIGAKVLGEVHPVKINHHHFLLGHGDALGSNEKVFKIIRKFFHSPFCQWLFARLHPNLGLSIAHLWSRESRKKGIKPEFNGAENEWIFNYCEEVEKTQHFDYYVFGHRHMPLELDLNNSSRYINLGDWVEYFTYGVFDGEAFRLCHFEEKERLPG